MPPRTISTAINKLRPREKTILNQKRLHCRAVFATETRSFEGYNGHVPQFKEQY
jgi:hypothetical protein